MKHLVRNTWQPDTIRVTAVLFEKVEGLLALEFQCCASIWIIWGHWLKMVIPSAETPPYLKLMITWSHRHLLISKSSCSELNRTSKCTCSCKLQVTAKLYELPTWANTDYTFQLIRYADPHINNVNVSRAKQAKKIKVIMSHSNLDVQGKNRTTIYVPPSWFLLDTRYDLQISWKQCFGISIHKTLRCSINAF